MSSSQQTEFGAWSEPEVPDYVERYANQVKEQAQKATLKEVGEFKSYVVTLFIQQQLVFGGTNYVVKVDTGNGDTFVEVQFFVQSLVVVPPRDKKAEFKAAKKTTESATLGPIIKG